MQKENFNYEINQIKTGANAGTSLLSGLMGNLGAVGDMVNSEIDLIKNEKNHDFFIKEQMAQIEKQKLMPDNASLSNSNSTLLGYELLDNNVFTIYSIKEQFARRIDNYFSMYGYATNELKVPNLNNRTNWNYVKLIGANILGDIPQSDLQAIKNIFNNGVTLWHNPSTFLDYSQNNT